jgi:hypothetical protein
MAFRAHNGTNSNMSQRSLVLLLLITTSWVLAEAETGGNLSVLANQQITLYSITKEDQNEILSETEYQQNFQLIK